MLVTIMLVVTTGSDSLIGVDGQRVDCLCYCKDGGLGQVYLHRISQDEKCTSCNRYVPKCFKTKRDYKQLGQW